jgi:thioesterase domain-containing protein/acyl carrier protein
MSPGLLSSPPDIVATPDVPAPLQPSMPDQASAPRDDVERRVVAIWHQVLGSVSIGRHDNFFELGGDSLLAVQLFAHLEKTFGRKLPLATLLQAPTVAQMADILRDPTWLPTWSSLVPIQPHGSRPPLFLAHAGGGHVLFYRNLAQHLGSEQPVYGLQAQGLEDQRPVYQRVEDMAAHYLRDIRSRQPQGPYCLGGWSFGGTVAFEMAQQLQAQGQPVALLVLLGPVVPPACKSLTYYVHQGLHSAWRHPLVCLRYVLRSGLPYAYQLPQLTRRLKVGLAPLWFTPPPTYPLPAPGFYTAQKRYLLQPYPGRITCLVPGDRARLSPYPWSVLAAGGLEWHGVTGDLESMLHEPHVQTLAATLQSCLASAQASRV